MNKWFNIKRFWLVLRHEFADTWHEIAIYAAIYIVSSLIPYAFKNNFNGMAAVIGVVIVNIIRICLVVYYWATASRLFANIQQPERRIGYLTLPASNAEKFYARLLLYWLLPTAIFFFPYPNSGIHTDSYVLYIILSLLIVESSLAVLFGTIFRRFGLLILILVEVVAIVGIVAYIAANERNLDMAWIMPLTDMWYNMEPGEGRIQKVAVWCTVVPTVLNIALARIIFSRKRLRRPLVNSEI